MGSYETLSFVQVGLAAVLILLNGAVSVALRLGMEKSLAIASVRTVTQLLLIGLVLEWVFQFERWYVVLGLGCVMTIMAGVTASGRSQRTYPGLRLDSIVSIWVSAWLVTGYALLAVLSGIDKWYQPQYAIPFLGMVLGNTLTGVAIGLNAFTDSLSTKRELVESELALGATRWEAAREPIRNSVRTGMIPIVNSMMVVGIVSLPGMMTGQLVSGMDPMEAVKYQIVIMFLIASSTALGTVLSVLFAFRRLFNSQHQFCFQLLVRRSKKS